MTTMRAERDAESMREAYTGADGDRQEVIMTNEDWEYSPDVSLFTVGTTLLRNRWRIVRWGIGGAVIAAAFAAMKPALFSASASFTPQRNDANVSGLASLAGQFGVSLPGGDQSQSPEFYAALLHSRVLLRPIVHDTFTLREDGGRRGTLLDLLGVGGPSESAREDRGIIELQKLSTASPAKATGIITVQAATKWPSLSLAIVQAMLRGVNDFNQTTRQSQAAAELRFVESQLGIASKDLEAAEGRLEAHVRANRQIGSSPELKLERDRLEREVSFRQQLVESWTKADNDARIRQQRDTPVITIVEQPWVPSTPQPRGRILLVLMGGVLGASLGAAVILIVGAVARHRAGGSQEAVEFVGTLDETLSGVRGLMSRRRIGTGVK
jgi:uncharacterized protein involved in exopolysaccharide biosynthesis